MSETSPLVESAGIGINTARQHAAEFATEAALAAAEYDDKPREECGVYGIWAPGVAVLDTLRDALKKLQHRGQSGAGGAWPDQVTGRLERQVGNGKVTDVFPEAISDQHGHGLFDLGDVSVAIGHTRYSTSESDNASQPFIGAWCNIAVAHNGHVEDVDEVAEGYDIDVSDCVSDSHKITRLLDVRSQALESLEAGMLDVLPKLQGAFSLTITDGERLIGVRDAWGHRPLALGRMPGGKGYALASESEAFKPSGAVFERDIEPGEIVVIGNTGVESFMLPVRESKECRIEYGYLAKPYETINGVPVYLARFRDGEHLAQDHGVLGDVVIAVPNSGRAAAAGYAAETGLPLMEGIFTKEGADRSFLTRAGVREAVLEDKHTVLGPIVRGKRCVLAEDSVIKGNTMKKIAKSMKAAGALEIVVLSALPRFEYACYAGLDAREETNLIAHGRTDEEIAAELGVDRIIFNTVERSNQAINDVRNGPPRGICDDCTTGKYHFTSRSFAEKAGGIALDTLPMAT